MNRYQKIEQLRNESPYVATIGDKYYNTVFYPEVGALETDIYVETEFTDRLDRLAFQFYGDVTLYWIIALSNPNKVGFGSLFIPVGTQLSIPTNISGFIDSYNRLNEL